MSTKSTTTQRRVRTGPNTAQPPPNSQSRGQAITLAPTPLPSKAGGAWPIDHARAKRDADVALSYIDWSKRDVVIWVPGTGGHTVNQAFAASLKSKHRDGNYSLTAMNYISSWDVRPSVSTGLESLRLVLQGIAAHGGDHRILLGGESQGAWIIGEAIADPMLRRVVDRVALLGHPGSATHHYDQGHDAGVFEYNDRWDHITIPPAGNPQHAIDMMSALSQNKAISPWLLLRVTLTNPVHALLMVGTMARSMLGEWRYDPHNYDEEMSDAVNFILTEHPTSPAGGAARRRSASNR